MLLLHQQILKANHTTKATVCGKQEVQRGVFFSYRENPELIGVGVALAPHDRKRKNSPRQLAKDRINTKWHPSFGRERFSPSLWKAQSEATDAFRNFL
jgi:hypothetical protein